MNKRIKYFIGLMCLISVFLLGGYLFLKSSSFEKYTVDYLKQNANITADNKILYIEDHSSALDEGEMDGYFYIEIQNYEKDYSVTYNVGGYEMGLYSINNDISAYSVIADEETKYLVNGDISESVMISDLQHIEDIFNIDYEHAKIRIMKLANDPGKKEMETESAESVNENSVADDSFINNEEDLYDEDIVLLFSPKYTYALYLDADSGKCNRLQVMSYDEEENIYEELYIVIEDVENGINYPHEIDQIDTVVEIGGDEFSELSFDFILGAMINTSMYMQTVSAEGSK